MQKHKPKTLEGGNLRKIRNPFKRLTLVPKVLSTFEKIIILLAILVFLGGSTWWGLRNYLNSTKVVPESGGTYNVGLVGQPRYINPLLAPTSDVDQDLSTLIFASLIKLDKDFKVEMDLAESVNVSKDKKSYQIKLKPNLKWHDGEALNADDVVFTIKAIQDPNWNSPLNLGFKGVTVDKIDDLTLKLTLQEVYAPFASTLTFGILPAHIWGSVPAASASLAEHNIKPIGSGPYKFDELTKDKGGTIKSLKLIANPDYHRGAPYIEKINVVLYDQPSDLVQAYQDNDIDTVGGLPFDQRSSLEGKKTQVLSLGLPRYDAIFINANQNSQLRSKAVREALSRAINKQDLVDQVLKGNGTVANSALVPGSLGYTDDVVKYGYSPKKAEKLLTDDGWEKNVKEKIYWKDGKRLTIQIVTADTPENRRLAELISKYWEVIGVKTTIVNAPVAELQQTYIRERKYQALLFGEVIGADPDLYPFWHSTQIADPGLNLTSFSNDDLDKLLEEARQTPDQKARAKKQTAISKILASDLHAIFLYSPNYLMAVRSKIQGVELKNINIPADRFNNIHLWYINTKRVPKEE